MSVAGADRSAGLGSRQGPIPPREVGTHTTSGGNHGVREQGFSHLRLSKRHCEQGIRPPLGQQGQSLHQLLLQLMDAHGLWLRPRETVELGVSVLEGPVVFHCGAEAQARGRRGN